MKRKLKILSFLAFLISLSTSSFAQGGTGIGVQRLPYLEVHMSKDKPMPYQFVREADVMWSRVIWRRVELTEKMNHILALPETPTRGTMSLIDVVLDAIHNKGLVVYQAKASDAGIEFNNIITEEQVYKEMGARTEFQPVERAEGGYDTIAVNIPYNSANITSYIVKELWFFDKQRSLLDVRIIGFCPILRYYRPEDELQLDPLYKKVFWVNYIEARPMLAQSPVYSVNTDLKNISFDDIFQKRFFSSYIYMESNPYQRAIQQYETGLEVLLEADRIKNEIFNFEQDLWEY